MGQLEEWFDVIFKDQPKMEATDRTGSVMVEASRRDRYLIDNVRCALGKIYSPEEYESWRRKVLNTPLP